MWAWGTPLTPDRLRIRDITIPAGVDVAIGEICSGPDAFRTSHRQAAVVERLAAQSATQGGGRLLSFTQLEPEVLMSTDPVAARSFVHRMLGDLAQTDPRIAEIRKTLLHYLECGKSLSRVAEDLYIARTTVTYRVHRGEELCGKTIDEHQYMLHAALRLRDYVIDY